MNLAPCLRRRNGKLSRDLEKVFTRRHGRFCKRDDHPLDFCLPKRTMESPRSLQELEDLVLLPTKLRHHRPV